MNRIILIGNGFDLAHGLPTGYVDFINHYWEDFSYHVLNGYARWQLEQYGTANIKPYSDNFASVEIIDRKNTNTKELPVSNKEQNAYNELCRFINSYNQTERFSDSIQLRFRNLLFERISAQSSLEDWVDIENEYYRLLKSICLDEKHIYETPTELNLSLKHLEDKLIAYLTEIQEEQIKIKLICEEIQSKIFAPFNTKDISVGTIEVFKQFLKDRFDYAQDEVKAKELLHKYGYSPLREWSDIEIYLKHIESSTHIDKHEVHMNQVFSRNESSIPSYFLLPEDILFLNFNYTSTASLYIPKQSGFRINHIHGELNNPDKPIIFGYGDEMDEDYKSILNLNENDYLENIKSICYLKTDNYRRLLTFIDSAPYQIIIMGHSCGNSDRTLLNTLFEHKNCVSIKPYYHQKDDGTDNYIDIIQNISRDFNDMTLMRDRVVNKRYCQPLIAH